ncbi:MAG: trehalose-6-phosphate synthase [Anaeromyxobacter sp.]|nr:trehalose-6-phosphate synthase [Anaeromyxobacter sp.]MBL0275569.1 trehalose-6-phosphate synthase [Anaeromyxobacter sp.]
MRAALRFLLLLVASLALVAWGASALFNRQARVWAERDMALRARLAVSAAGPSLRAASQQEARAVLDVLVRDERLMGSALCWRDGRSEAATDRLPARLGCAALPVEAREAGEAGWDHTVAGPAGSTHLTVMPVDDQPQGRLLLLVHDLSFVDRRAGTTRRYTFLAFALVGLLGAAAAAAVARLSWLSWTAQLRKVLLAPFRAAEVPTPRHFQPLLSDVRDLVASLAAEESRTEAGWTPERLRLVLRRQLGGEGILVVANREPYIHEHDGQGGIRVAHPASGLVTALEPVMRACSGTWIAHGSGDADFEVVDARDHVGVPPGRPVYDLRRLRLSEAEEQGYYYGFSNEGLWPLCHVAHTRPEFRSADWEQYQRVNRRFAEAVAEEATSPDPIVLVQDYHFALLPRYLRERLPRATILTFWHIPWPNAERFGICPWERAVLEGLLGSSIVGFHTQAHCNNFMESVDRYLETRLDRERHSVVQGGRETLVRPYPISIEWPSRWADGAPSVAECRVAVRRELGIPDDALLGLGVDRLDYTKGIEERLLAVERLLERSPEYHGRFWFAQAAAPSRAIIPAYRALGERVEALAQRINQRFARPGWSPILLARRHHEPPDVFRMYRAADLCYVSSLHDGMNLVAKEFVAARDDQRGVLVLSRFTGASRELTEALVVNPYDIDSSATALAAALAMPALEQEERMRSMRALVSELNVYRWAGKMLLDATRTRRRERLVTKLSSGGGAR